MARKSCWAFGTSLLVLTTPALAQEPAPVQDREAVSVESPVTYERILNADQEPQNWLTHNGNYAGHRHSLLDQINRDNVRNLQFAFAVAVQNVEKTASGSDGEVEATPLVDNGFIYTTDGWGRVYKIDATSGLRGTIAWKMDPAVAADYPWGSVHHRGVALLGDNVYSLAKDGRLIATNKATGEVLWEETFTQNEGEYFTMAPLAVKDMMLWGAAGGETGSRGWITATNAESGELVWLTHTIPGPGEPGHETWADDHNAYLTGGGSIWMTPVFNPETNTVIWGVGNPSPDIDPEYRPGDNLYTNSALAVDADTGEIEWYFQYTPNDQYDFDEVGSHILMDLEIDGEVREVVGHVARNGFYYTLDRGTGEFIVGDKYLEQVNWTAGLDPKTGMPVEYDPAAQIQAYAVAPRRGDVDVPLCPTISGGTNWWPTSFNPRTGWIYGAAIEGCGTISNANVAEAVAAGDMAPGKGAWFGGSQKQTGTIVGSIYAVDPTTGQLAAKRMTPFQSIAGVMTTAGGLVFAGQLDGEFEAMDEETLEVLWRVNLGTMMEAPPVSYEVDGVQYIAVMAGGRPSYVPARYEVGENPELGMNIENSYNLWVFRLPQG